ncbi:uncharacterized protein LOC126999050 [Eriocheir sinensis]|uniref:uncharacterized protein LOC126999050 n=1 Tax=Eriocheir sinensis TaxID=95602 RepID=UPI0021CAD089|nr:uncharacterized protein LOC126999050 [Eriocheir sinensis]
MPTSRRAPLAQASLSTGGRGARRAGGPRGLQAGRHGGEEAVRGNEAGNPTNDIKTKLNRIIRQTNNNSSTKLPLIEGDHKLGYAYANVKTHKEGHPLRPIISQTPSVTYKLAKRLNELITPFTPASFNLKSTIEFLDLLKTTRPSNIMASMDVESLFTNVPVDKTTDLICQRIYHLENEEPLNIPEASLRLLLQACTKEVPFYGPDGKMYVQRDGVAMGSPLGVLFANFYMGSIEERLFARHPQLKPQIYARYVDDIFISVGTVSHINELITEFKNDSCLNFTQEIEQNKKLPFLDTMVHREDTSFSTEVYVKATNFGFCLNGASECPERYRRSVISAFVKRALTHTSVWAAANTELKRVSQLLANNGYPQQEIDDGIKRRLDNFMSPEPKEKDPSRIILYYKNTMSSEYKEDEKTLKKIIHKNVTPTNPDTKLDLIIFHKSRKTANLIMRNSCLPPTSPLQEKPAINIQQQPDTSLLTKRQRAPS